MMRRFCLPASLILALGLGGCAGQQDNAQVLAAAQASFDQVKDDSDVLRSAPKDVIRAGESLARAERLANYWGNGDDVAHYAYLSQRYSEIARQHSELGMNQERLAKLELERERLQLNLREAKLLSVQQQGIDQEGQMISLAATETDRGLIMTLGDMLFDPTEADLKASANRTLLKLAQFLQLNPRRVVRIEGYTDARGDTTANLALSKARAQTVADMLIDLGIDSKRIAVEGYGEAYPVADNASERGRAQNRRVEIVFSDDKGQLGAAR